MIWILQHLHCAQRLIELRVEVGDNETQIKL